MLKAFPRIDFSDPDPNAELPTRHGLQRLAQSDSHRSRTRLHEVTATAGAAPCGAPGWGRAGSMVVFTRHSSEGRQVEIT